MRRIRVQEILSHATFVVVMCAIGIFAMNIIGCGEEVENPVEAEGAIGTTGNLKIPDTAPGAPQVKIPEGTPTVKSVGYYSDWQLTKPLTGTVSEGKTIFIKVEFSEGMKLVVADDKHARPILYRRVNGKLIRFNIANFGAKGEDFVSGDAKPVKTKASFICKYIVQPEDTGEFVFAVGKLSTDLQGNLLPAFYTHKEKLRLGKPLSPTVKSVDYYSDWQLTKPLTGTIQSGAIVYTKIVFSEGMEHVVSDGVSARPEMYYRIGDRDVQHNIVPFGATGKHYAPGDTKPIKIQTTYVGKYRVKSGDYGTFTLVAGKESANKKGVKIAEEYVHTEALRIPDPPPPTVTITGAPTGVDNADVVSVAVRDRGATHYKYSVGVGEECGEYGNPTPIHRRLTVNVSDLPDGTVTLCVLGKNIASIWQTKPTTVQWTRDSSVVLEPVIVVTEPEPTDEDVPSQRDFSGRVFVPGVDNPISFPVRPRLYSQPVSGVTVTITAGLRSGESVVTNQGGWYFFRNVREDALHLRVEKTGFETKEVIVYRSFSTTLADGTALNYPGDPQQRAGNVLIGHAWPDKSLLRQVRTVSDPLFISTDLGQDLGGFYNLGVIGINTRIHNAAHRANLLAHEIAHLHQHALVSPSGIGDNLSWPNTPSGIAFVAARQKDWNEVGKARFDQLPWFSSVVENAAETFAYYWTGESRGTYGDLKVTAPNRYKWAEQWLPK